MDDRLGEVIYRAAMITIDQLMASAVKVNRDELKFGQVLLNSKIFTTVDLWRALKMQVLEIIGSVFMVEHVYFEFSPGRNLAPTQIVFAEGSAEIIEERSSFGGAFRKFSARVQPSTKVSIADWPKISGLFPEGTFVGDFVSLVHAQGDVEKLMASSKLIRSNSIAALMHCVDRDLVQIDAPPAIDTGEGKNLQMAALKSKIDAYFVLLAMVRKAFEAAHVPMPAADLKTFAAEMNPVGFSSLFLNEHLEVSANSLESMFAQVKQSGSRAKYFEIRIESLIQFLLQISGDLLAFPVAKEIRQSFRNMLP